MLVKKAAERDWTPTGHAGVERSLFRNNESGGRSSVVRLREGARVPRHVHHGHEEVLVLSGVVTLDGTRLEAGDYLYTTPGEAHDVVGVTDAVIFVSSQKAVQVIES